MPPDKPVYVTLCASPEFVLPAATTFTTGPLVAPTAAEEAPTPELTCAAVGAAAPSAYTEHLMLTSFAGSAVTTNPTWDILEMDGSEAKPGRFTVILNVPSCE